MWKVLQQIKTNYLKIKRPKNAIGCLMERTRLNTELLGPKAKKLIKTYNLFRIECFKKYVRNAQADGKFKKNLNPQYTAEYILAQFNMIQTYRLNAHSKGDDDRPINEINYFQKIDPLNIIKKKSNYFSKKFKLIDSEVSNYFTISSKKKS